MTFTRTWRTLYKNFIYLLKRIIIFCWLGSVSIGERGESFSSLLESFSSSKFISSILLNRPRYSLWKFYNSQKLHYLSRKVLTRNCFFFYSSTIWEFIQVSNRQFFLRRFPDCGLMFNMTFFKNFSYII